MSSIYTPYRPERYTIKKYLGKGKYGGHIFEVYELEDVAKNARRALRGMF